MKTPLCIPEKILDQHLVVLGKTGAGKSSALRHIVEHLLSMNKRVCIVDPKGDWWGLKSSADGKSAGFPVIAFGDFKEAKASDVPINSRSGKHVAELITSGNRPCLIGFRGWMPSAMTSFWIDFASTIFNANAGELYLVIDEVHNFTPKGKVLNPEVGKSIHWTNRMLSEGRGVGLVCLTASQRPQKVHNDTLTCCETLVAMRVVHAADRQAIKDWIDGCGDKEHGNTVLNLLAGFARGEAMVWSPEIGYGPTRIKFPMFETFDSFAPPQLQKKITESGWADVNLDAVKQKLASVIEEAKANDPKELRAEISRLKSEIARKPAAAPVIPIPPRRPAMTPEQLKLLEKAVFEASELRGSIPILSDRAERIWREMNTIADNVRAIERREEKIESKIIRVDAREVSGKPKPRRDLESFLPNGTRTGSQQKILDTLAMLKARGLSPNRDMLARWLDLHPGGGRYCGDLRTLKLDGLIEGAELTQAGASEAMAESSSFQAMLEVLTGSQAAIVKILAEGGEYTRDTLAERLGLHPGGGRYCGDLRRLRIMGVIPERGEISLTQAARA